MGETCLTFRGRNRGCDKPLLQEALEHGYGSSCETSELWSCWRAQGLLKGTLFCCRDGEAASGILPHRLPGLLRSSVDHHGLIPSTQLQVGQRLSLIDCIHHQIPLPQLPSPPVSSQHPTLLPWTLRQRTKVFVGGSSPHSRETEAQKGRWDGAGPCRLGPDLQAGYSLWPSWALGVLDSGGHARQVIGGCGSQEERSLWLQCWWGWAVITARKNQRSASMAWKRMPGTGTCDSIYAQGPGTCAEWPDWLLGSSLGQHRTD